jgi:alpha-glucuronidase
MVSYMMPLGLAHLFAWEHHYGPDPGFHLPGARPDWLPPYYHRADSVGLGFDRTTNGSNAVSQYFPPLRDSLNNPETCPEKFLLWFHHIPWNYRMQSGRTLWEELRYKYQSGVDAAFAFQKLWEEMKPYIDEERFKAIQAKLKIQVEDAIIWRDVCLGYFQPFGLQ